MPFKSVKCYCIETAGSETEDKRLKKGGVPDLRFLTGEYSDKHCTETAKSAKKVSGRTSFALLICWISWLFSLA